MEVFRRSLPVCLSFLAFEGLVTFPASAQPSFSVFGGVVTDNTWEEIAFTPWNTDIQKPGLFGVGVSFPIGPMIDTRLGRLRFEVEGQIVRHVNLQEHWEFNLPLTARLYPQNPLFTVIDSMAFGIGPSYATSPPRFEKVRGNGDVSRGLIYWHFELEHRLTQSTSGEAIFARLHHRSDGFGTIGPGGSSNSLVVGLRKDL